MKLSISQTKKRLWSLDITFQIIILLLWLNLSSTSFKNKSIIEGLENLQNLTGLKGHTLTDYIKSLPIIKSEVKEANSSCPGKNILIEYRQVTVSDEGNGTKLENLTYIDTKTSYHSKTISMYHFLKETLLLSESKLLPYINCLEMDNTELINIIKLDLLVPPSSKPYWFRGYLKVNSFVPEEEEEEGLTEPADMSGQDNQPNFLDKHVFKGEKKGGFFIEAGSTDNEWLSNTLLFEIMHNWTGLLVEPCGFYFKEGLKRHRKAWNIQTCLAVEQRPHYTFFDYSGSDQNNTLMMGIAGPLNQEAKTDEPNMQCLPLYSILLALDNPVVDLLVLDIEGAELQVLKTLPWDKVTIRVLLLETGYQGLVFPGSREDIRSYLKELGYTLYAFNNQDEVYLDHETLRHATPINQLPHGFDLSENSHFKKEL